MEQHVFEKQNYKVLFMIVLSIFTMILCSITLLIFFFIVDTVTGTVSASSAVGCGVLALFLWILSIVFLFNHATQKVIVADSGLKITSLFKEKKYPWHTIKEIGRIEKPVAVGCLYYIKARDHSDKKIIIMSNDVKGSDQFSELLVKHAPTAKKQSLISKPSGSGYIATEWSDAAPPQYERNMLEKGVRRFYYKNLLVDATPLQVQERIVGNHYLEVKTVMRKPKAVRIQIFKKSIANWMAFRSIGRKTASIGNPTFDNAFIVECNDKDYIKRFLAYDIQEPLRRISAKFSFCLKVEKARMNFSVFHNDPLKIMQNYDDILEISTVIIDKLLQV